MNTEQGYNFVQGLNLIAGIFLYVMKNEVEAFYCFHHFMTKMYPNYFYEDYSRTPSVLMNSLIINNHNILIFIHSLLLKF